MAFPEQLAREFEELASHYPDRKAALIPALHRCQEELGGWISPEIMESCAEFFGLEPVEVYGVVSFYPMFRLSPPGKHVVGICRNISCDLRGAAEIAACASQHTGAEMGTSSADGRFYLEAVECQGGCTNAPMMVVDGVYHEDLTPADVEKILGAVK